MIKIGITGSLASGKTSASKILSHKRGPLFSADNIVNNLYQNKNFKFLLSKKFKIKNNNLIIQLVSQKFFGFPKDVWLSSRLIASAFPNQIFNIIGPWLLFLGAFVYVQYPTCTLRGLLIHE